MERETYSLGETSRPPGETVLDNWSVDLVEIVETLDVSRHSGSTLASSSISSLTLQSARPTPSRSRSMLDSDFSTTSP